MCALNKVGVEHLSETFCTHVDFRVLPVSDIVNYSRFLFSVKS